MRAMKERFNSPTPLRYRPISQLSRRKAGSQNASDFSSPGDSRSSPLEF